MPPDDAARWPRLLRADKRQFPDRARTVLPACHVSVDCDVRQITDHLTVDYTRTANYTNGRFNIGSALGPGSRYCMSASRMSSYPDNKRDDDEPVDHIHCTGTERTLHSRSSGAGLPIALTFLHPRFAFTVLRSRQGADLRIALPQATY